MRFGKLEIDPALSPGVLDTATWDRAAASAAVAAVDPAYWPALLGAAEMGAALPPAASLAPHAASVAWRGDAFYCLAGLPDGQQVLLEAGPGSDESPLGAGIWNSPLPAPGDGPQHPPALNLRVHPTDAPVLDRFLRQITPDKGPRALGPVPRLGVGTRMTTAVWPAIWEAMDFGGFAANAIQNSVRELNFLETLLEGRPAEKNIAFGFGTIEAGYTGSSFEGLWVSGVLDALRHSPQGHLERRPVSSEGHPERRSAGPESKDARCYGADADHIQVKRGPDGLARAKRMLDATRYYSFYTLDVSDVLDYAALTGHAGPARVPEPSIPSDVLGYHRQPRRIGGFDYRPDAAMVGRLAGKYWAALDAVEALRTYICDLKGGQDFDLELSIDEHPNDVPTFECLTSKTELIFVLLEAQRRGIALTHIAPNFGVEKGTDYRGSDGLVGFEARARDLCRIAEEQGVMADFHSGDDLSAAARQAIGRATGGRNHFKVSPNLQLLFGEVLASHHPGLFRRWWEDALAYARTEAAAGSAFAVQCLTAVDPADASDLVSLAHDPIFHHFSFAFVGRRDAGGQFICREEFYDLSPAFYQAYKERILEYLLELAADLGQIE